MHPFLRPRHCRPERSRHATKFIKGSVATGDLKWSPVRHRVPAHQTVVLARHFRVKDEAVRAYDFAVWRLGLSCSKLNFPEVQSRIEAEFVGPRVTIVSRPDTPKTRIVFDDGSTTRRLTSEGWQGSRGSAWSAQYEANWYWKRDQELQKQRMTIREGLP